MMPVLVSLSTLPLVSILLLFIKLLFCHVVFFLSCFKSLRAVCIHVHVCGCVNGGTYDPFLMACY